MKLTIATVAILVCVCAMKGIRADDSYGYGGNYGASYGVGSYGPNYGVGSYGPSYGSYGGSYGGWGSGLGKSGFSGYGNSGYSGYGKSGYSGYGNSGHDGGYGGYGYGSGYGSGHGSGYGKKGYSGYGKKGGFVEETIILPGAPIAAPIEDFDGGLGGGLFGGDSTLPILGLGLAAVLLLRNSNGSNDD